MRVVATLVAYSCVRLLNWLSSRLPLPSLILLEQLADRFRHFADVETAGSSPLYSALASATADDAGLLALAAHVPAGQPPANLFLSAVHFILLRERTPDLAAFFPSLTARPASPADAASAFKTFAHAHADEIRQLLQTRRVQTNEVGRCAYLLPSAVWMNKLIADRPLALIEIGTSAGLNLLWDQYAYRYDLRGSSLVANAGESSVLINSELRRTAPALSPMPQVVARLGCDLNVIDLGNADDRAWLNALIWPEHADRRALLAAALAEARRHKLHVLQGDAAERWDMLVALAPSDAALLVYHTHVLNQLSDAARAALDAKISMTSHARPVMRLGNDFVEGDGVAYRLELQHWTDGTATTHHLANVHGHGRWVEWLA